MELFTGNLALHMTGNYTDQTTEAVFVHGVRPCRSMGGELGI